MSKLSDNLKSLESLLSSGLIDEAELESKKEEFKAESYSEAMRLLEKNSSNAEAEAQKLFEELGDYRDSRDQAKLCVERKKQYLLSEGKEKTSKRNKTIAIVVAVLVGFVLLFSAYSVFTTNANNQAIEKAKSAVAGKTFKGNYKYGSVANVDLVVKFDSKADNYNIDYTDTGSNYYHSNKTHEAKFKVVPGGVAVDLGGVEPFKINYDGDKVVNLVTSNWNSNVGTTLSPSTK